MEPGLISKYRRCIQCGNCTGSCPETGITPFNVRKMIRKYQLQKDFDLSLLWYCTSCGECSLRCPRDVKASEIITELRGNMVEEGRIPNAVQKALENTYIHKNPWGKPRNKRDYWSKNRDDKINHISNSTSHRLLFTCCIEAYDPRCMAIPENVSSILSAAQIDFGVLGNDEACCGNEIKRIGESGLFEEIQEENSRLFHENDVKEIITLSPHCMNTLKNEYELGDIKVRHYSELLSDLIKNKTISFKREYKKKVIYHDPCYLGKLNKVFEAPRLLLGSVPGLQLMEFSYSGENSLCCEGGGGRMFHEVGDTYVRNSETRVKEAIKKGADEIVTACPFCLMTLEDPAKEYGIPVRELSEILIEVI